MKVDVNFHGRRWQFPLLVAEEEFTITGDRSK